MPHTLTVAILAGAGGMLGWGFADFFAKKSIDAAGELASMVWAHFFGSVGFGLIVAYTLLRHQTLNIPDASHLLLIAFFGVLQAIIYFLLYRGFGKGQVSVLNSFFASFPGITAILSVLFFHEALSGRGVPLLIIFAGIVVLNLDMNALRERKLRIAYIPGIREVALATVLAGLWTVLWDQLIGGQDWVIYAFLMYLCMTFVLYGIAKWLRADLLRFQKHALMWCLFVGIGETIAYAAISIGYSQTTYTSIIALISGAFALPTVILAWIFLKERLHGVQIAGCVAILCGIALVAFG